MVVSVHILFTFILFIINNVSEYVFFKKKTMNNLFFPWKLLFFKTFHIFWSSSSIIWMKNCLLHFMSKIFSKSSSDKLPRSGFSMYANVEKARSTVVCDDGMAKIISDSKNSSGSSFFFSCQYFNTSVFAGFRGCFSNETNFPLIISMSDMQSLLFVSSKQASNALLSM